MRIRFLGIGGAFDYQLGNSSAWVEWADKRILLDCGSTVYGRLRDLDLINSYDYVLLTHLHDDHVGSLTTAIYHQRFFTHSPRKTRIIYPDTTFRDLCHAYLKLAMTDPDAYVDFIPISEFDGLYAIPTTDLHIPGMASYGYVFEEGSDVLVYSGDIGDPNHIFRFLSQFEGKKITVFHDLAFQDGDGVHVFYRDLFPHLDQYRIFGYHTDPTANPADNRVPLVAHTAEFMF
jgi:glyoxylase-like metal-dependent hydrolase (beta-lactamase superfamily II)